MAETSPLQDKLITLIGGSGFIGTHVAQDLLARGARLRIVSRNPKRAFKLQPLGKLGQIQLAHCDVRDEASVAACVNGADGVVYLAGTFGKDQHAIQATGAGFAAKAAAATGAASFVYLSAIGADADSDSGYWASKGEGESLVLDAFPKASIMRPSAVFGEEAGFVPLFAKMVSLMPVVPVFGAEAQLQPVWVDDLAGAIGNALANPQSHGGKIFEIGGPDVLTMDAIYAQIAAGQKREPTFLPVPDFIAGIIAAMPLAPIGKDQLAMLKAPNVVSDKAKSLASLGVAGHPLSLFLDKWMVCYCKHGRFAEKQPA